MDFEIRTEIDRQHSCDPSYIVRYQVFQSGRFIGDGVAQFHRLAEHNDFDVPETVRKLDGSSLEPELKEKIKKEIDATARIYINKYRS